MTRITIHRPKKIVLDDLDYPKSNATTMDIHAENTHCKIFFKNRAEMRDVLLNALMKYADKVLSE